MEYLHDIISFEGFEFANYFNDEQNILKPRLERLGYRNIRFSMGESDSFGPLSRTVTMTDSNNQVVKAWYG